MSPGLVVSTCICTLPSAPVSLSRVAGGDKFAAIDKISGQPHCDDRWRLHAKAGAANRGAVGMLAEQGWVKTPFLAPAKHRGSAYSVLQLNGLLRLGFCAG